MAQTNLLERLDKIGEAVNRIEAGFYLKNNTIQHNSIPSVSSECNHIFGVVEEILTMIDGR